MLDPFAAVECGRINGFVYLRHSPTPVECGLIEAARGSLPQATDRRISAGCGWRGYWKRINRRKGDGLTDLRMRASEDAVEGKAQIKVVEIESPAQMEQAWAIRRRVFIEEQHVPEESELAAHVGRALDAEALDGGEAV